MKRSSAKGFSLIEICITLGLLSVALVTGTSLTVWVKSIEQKAIANRDSLSQRELIRQKLFTSSTSSSVETCLSRLNLPPVHTFTPGTDFNLTGLNPSSISSILKVDRLYLKDAVLAGAVGLNELYSTQMIIEQSKRSPSGVYNDFRPFSVGSFLVQVDPTNHIVGCGWDPTATNALDFCSTSTGMQSDPGLPVDCNPIVNQPPAGACPAGTAFDSLVNHCVPALTDCTANTLANNFDGNRFGCNTIATSYAFRYPATYTPPSTSPSAQNCICGPNSMAPSGSDFCVTATKVPELLGNFDDKFHLQVCNSVGVLEDAPTPYLFEEQGIGTHWGPKVATCAVYGGHINQGGTHYSTGNCW